MHSGLQPAPQTGVSIFGERDQGQDVRTNNVMAVSSIANIVKNSLGPLGLDKMLVDDIGDITITNDGAQILRQIEVEHPAAKTIVQLSQLQDHEVGDGTTSVVILAAELCKRANELIKAKVHPTSIISGFKIACRESVKYIQENLTIKVDSLSRESLINVAKTTMSSKIIHGQQDLFSSMCVDAILTVKTVNYLGDYKYPVSAVNILKAHGSSLTNSSLVKGYALQTMRASQQMPVKVENAKIACLDMNLHKFRMALGVVINVDDPENIEKIRQRECDILKERIQKIIDAGANVIVTTQGIDDIAQKYMVERKIMGLRRVSKQDVRRIAKASGAELITTMATTEGEEVFESSYLGTIQKVYEQNLGDQDFVFFTGFKNATAATLILRGPNEFMLDEIERSVHDTLCTLKRALESGLLVAGGGAVEVALSIYLEDFAKTLGSKEQIAISEFCEALQIIPLILAQNAALDASDLLSKLRVFHNAAQKSDDPEKKELKWVGLDLYNGKCRNQKKAGVLEPVDVKIKSLRFATEACIAILRIDDMIKLAPQQEDIPNRR